jgi:quercetin dioxygenase-like cupin family protein
LGAADFMMLAGRLGYRAGPPEGYGPGSWFFEPAGARHESTQNVTEEETIYLANIYGPIQFDSGVGTPINAVLSWMTYLQMAEACGAPLVKNVFPGDSTHLAPATSLLAVREPSPAETPAATYNPEWTPTGIEGGVDANKLPWVDFPQGTGYSYKPLRASHETGKFSLIIQMKKGTVQPDLVHLGAADFMVLTGKMTYPSGPMAGTLEAGVWGYIPAEAKIFGLVAEEDVEFLMNFYGPFAFLADDRKSVRSLFTASDVRSAASHRGITLIPSTLSECMQLRPAEYEGPAEPLAISRDGLAELCTQAKGIAENGVSNKHPHYVDTKAIDWFESMPGVGLKVLRVSEETGVVTAMVRHMAVAPPHYHLGPADFLMLAGHLGYRAGPPEGYGPGSWFYEPAGARHEATQNVSEEETIYLANIYGPIQFDSGVGTPITAVLSWMSYLQMAEASGSPLVQNVFPKDSSHLVARRTQ